MTLNPPCLDPVLRRKSTTIRCRMRISAWSPNRTSRCRSSEPTRSEKCRRPSSSRAARKPNSPRWSSNRTSRKRSSRASRSSRRIAWRIRLWTNRSAWLRWRLKKIAKGACSRCRGSTTIAWTTRTTCVSKKRKKSCRWRSSRWSSSRSSRIRKQCKKTLTKSWSVHWKSRLPWWLPSESRLLTRAPSEQLLLNSRENSAQQCNLAYYRLKTFTTTSSCPIASHS